MTETNFDFSKSDSVIYGFHGKVMPSVVMREKKQDFLILSTKSGGLTKIWASNEDDFSQEKLLGAPSDVIKTVTVTEVNSTFPTLHTLSFAGLPNCDPLPLGPQAKIEKRVLYKSKTVHEVGSQVLKAYPGKTSESLIEGSYQLGPLKCAVPHIEGKPSPIVDNYNAHVLNNNQPHLYIEPSVLGSDIYPYVIMGKSDFEEYHKKTKKIFADDFAFGDARKNFSIKLETVVCSPIKNAHQETTYKIGQSHEVFPPNKALKKATPEETHNQYLNTEHCVTGFIKIDYFNVGTANPQQ